MVLKQKKIQFLIAEESAKKTNIWQRKKIIIKPIF